MGETTGGEMTRGERISGRNDSGANGKVGETTRIPAWLRVHWIVVNNRIYSVIVWYDKWSLKRAYVHRSGETTCPYLRPPYQRGPDLFDFFPFWNIYLYIVKLVNWTFQHNATKSNINQTGEHRFHENKEVTMLVHTHNNYKSEKKYTVY